MKESLERMNQAKESASKKKSEAILAADDELAQAMGVVTLSLVAIAISVSIDFTWRDCVYADLRTLLTHPGN